MNEIVVTAQKRSQNLQDVPIAISAVTGDQLSDGGLSRPGDLSSTVPNLQAASTLGVTTVFLRGVGNGQFNVGPDSSVAYYADGVYVARPRAQTAGFFDVERIEVVRGPQGDLYGRNATGGAISIITRKPTSSLSANLSASYGNYNSVRLEGGVGGPIAGDTVKARISGYYSDHDGYGRNLVTGNKIDGVHEYGGRLWVTAEPSPFLTIELVADYFKADDTLGGQHSFGPARPDTPLTGVAGFGGQVASDPRDVATERDPSRDQEAYGFAGTVTYDLSDMISLKSITGYRNSESLLLSDISGSSGIDLNGVQGGPLDQYEKQEQFSQEVQLLLDGDRWNAIIGGYYFYEDLTGSVRVPFFFAPGAALDFDGTGNTNAYALFGNLNWEFTDEFTLILGARYSYEKRSNKGSFTQVYATTLIDDEKSWDSFTPKATLQYSPSRNFQLYGTVSKGFKSGGYTIGSAEPAVNPETLWDYEAGLKFSTADRVLSGNIAAFYYDYTDLVVFRTVGVTTISENAAKATIKGIEAEFVIRPDRHFRFDASFGYLDAKYDSYKTADPTYPERGEQTDPTRLGEQDLSGNYLTKAPKFTVRTAASYTRQIGNGDLTVSGDLKFRSREFFTPFNDRNAYSPSNAELGANIDYRFDNGLRIGAYGRNLTNETVITFSQIGGQPVGYPRLGVLNEPRTYGVVVGYQF